MNILRPGSTNLVRDETTARFEGVVHRFVIEHRARTARELRFYQIQPDFRRVIEVAALAQLPSGKRHPHQRRIPKAVLEEARDRLLSADLQRCTSFGELFDVVAHEIASIRGIGELTVYDVALHIGAFLGLEPEVVYLHRGTREGAKAIGVGTRQKTIRVENLPEPFHILTPAEIEDCLCIYKDELRELAGG